MNTMTLEQVRDALRKIEGGERGVFDAHLLAKDAPKAWADAIDAHLRERESAKAQVTDEMVRSVWIKLVAPATPTSVRRTSVTEVDVRAALEAVAPMLASAQQDFSATYHGVLIRKMVEMLKNDEWADLFTGDEILGDLQVQIARLLASARMPDGFAEKLNARLETLEVPDSLSPSKAEYWKAGARRVIREVNVMLAAAPKRGEG